MKRHYSSRIYDALTLHLERTPKNENQDDDPPTVWSVEKQLETWWQKDANLQGKNDSSIPIAYAFLAQFILHDLTWSSKYCACPLEKKGAGIGQLGLRTLYGNQKKLLDEKGFFSLGYGIHPLEPDLPRDENGEAILSDTRNASNVPISQLTLGFLKFHNQTVKRLSKQKEGDTKALISEAKRELQWHYQWLILNDFLPRLTGKSGDVLINNYISKKTTSGNPSISKMVLSPVLSTPVLRIVAGMMTNKYLLNEPLCMMRMLSDSGRIPIHGQRKNTPGLKKSLSLHSNEKLPPFWSIQWDLWLNEKTNTKGNVEQYCPTFRTSNLSINGSYNPFPKHSLKTLVSKAITTDSDLHMPNGKEIAELFGKIDHPTMPEDAPLWYYLLAEAEEFHGGFQLGSLGAKLISHFFIDKLYRTPDSYLNVNPRWVPTSKEREKENSTVYQLKDFLREAGMPMSREDIEELAGL